MPRIEKSISSLLMQFPLPEINGDRNLTLGVSLHLHRKLYIAYRLISSRKFLNGRLQRMGVLSTIVKGKIAYIHQEDK